MAKNTWRTGVKEFRLHKLPFKLSIAINKLNCTNVHFFDFSDDRTSSLSETMKIGAFAERKKKHFEEPRLDLPFCTFFADKISLNEQQIEDESQSMAASPENDRLSGHVDENEEQSTAQQKTDSAKNEKNGNVSAQPEVSMVSTGDDFIMVDLVIFLFGWFCLLVACY